MVGRRSKYQRSTQPARRGYHRRSNCRTNRHGCSVRHRSRSLRFRRRVRRESHPAAEVIRRPLNLGGLHRDRAVGLIDPRSICEVDCDDIEISRPVAVRIDHGAFTCARDTASRTAHQIAIRAIRIAFMDVEIVIVTAGGPLNFDRNGLAGVIAGCHVEDKGIAIDAFNRGCFIGASRADGGAIPFDGRGRAGIDCAAGGLAACVTAMLKSEAAQAAARMPNELRERVDVFIGYEG